MEIFVFENWRTWRSTKIKPLTEKMEIILNSDF